MIRKFLFATACVVAAAPAYSAPAGTFIRDVVKADNSEVRLGRLIEARGGTPEVRAYGRMLVHDHSQNRIQAAALARGMGVRPPTSVLPDARAEYTKLSHMHGPAFDREARRAMIVGHRMTIAKFQVQARSGDRGTGAFARATLPTLRKHLRMAQAIRG